MADRPILFFGAMVRSLLAGTKTQTRRILTRRNSEVLGSSWAGKTAPWEGLRFDEAIVRECSPISGARDVHLAVPFCHPADQPMPSEDCGVYRVRPAIEVGDRLWCRESVGRRTASVFGIKATNGVESAFYVADDSDVVNADGYNICPWWKKKGAIPGIHMPRWASRITLTVTDVRVQRLLDISNEDAEAEGFKAGQLDDGFGPRDIGGGYTVESPGTYASAAGMFQLKWQELHPDWDGYSSPWVIALTFTVERANIDSLKVAA